MSLGIISQDYMRYIGIFQEFRDNITGYYDLYRDFKEFRDNISSA